MTASKTCLRLFCCLLLLSGCSLSGPSRQPETALYLLELESQERASSPSVEPLPGACLSLRISRPESAPGFLTSRMAYRQQANQLEYFALHRWVDTPANMVAAALARQLERSGLYTAVLTGSADIPTDLRLDTQLLRLLQTFDGTSSHVELALRFDLVQLQDRSLVRSEVLTYSEPAAGNPVAGVAAANRALQRLLEDLNALLAVQARAQSAKCSASGPSKDAH